MKKIALVTDSTADLPPDIIKKHTIHVIPLKILFGTETIIDNEISYDHKCRLDRVISRVYASFHTILYHDFQRFFTKIALLTENTVVYDQQKSMDSSLIY